MFVLGHVGIGVALADRLLSRLDDRRWIAWMIVGALLPDFVDKPLFYLQSLLGGSIFPGTRTLGHALSLPLSLGVLAWAQRSRVGMILALGVASHILLDQLCDTVHFVFDPANGKKPDFSWGSDRTAGLLFPLLGFRFMDLPFDSASQHLGRVFSPVILFFEFLGAWLFWRVLRRRGVFSGKD